MIPRSILFVCLFLTSILFLGGQNLTIKGVITNMDNQPIPTVRVKIHNGNAEVLTDAGGFYSLEAPTKAKLIVSHTGFKTKKIPIKGQEIINITLKYDQKSIKEQEVNTGYGKINQSESTLSVSSVDEKLIDRENYLDMATFLKTLPGVNVTEEGGQIKIVIRGNRSLMSSNAPLIILNGSQYNGSLNHLNPRDIKAIDVLKDASATVVYGSRGANGVILITTK